MVRPSALARAVATLALALAPSTALADAAPATMPPSTVPAAPPPPPPPAPPVQLPRAPGAPPRTTINEGVSPDAASQYFFLHDDNYFALQANGGWPARVKFQFSIRFEVVSLREQNNLGINFAYTQKSFWDLFAFDRSSPFVESDYKPELFFSYRPERLQRFREIQLGFQHESNGLGVNGSVDQSGDSRGWNNVFLDGRWGISRSKPAAESWFYFTPGLRVWYPFVVSPGLMNQIGYLQAYLDVDLNIPEHPWVGRLATRLTVREHNIEDEIYYPLLAFVTGGGIRSWIFVQIFYGQAERLITAADSVTHIYAGLGFL